MSPPEIPGFEDLREIGRGGFGTVYRARQVSLSRDVAIKVLDRVERDADALRRFQLECRAMVTIGGARNVVNVFDAGSQDGIPYLVMEYLPHGSLDDLLKKSGPMQPSTVIRAGRDVAQALSGAHARGVLHRDVKPSNVLLTTDGECKLADFGIAAIFSENPFTATGVSPATIDHAAPEVLDGARGDVRSDLYSLGSAMFTLLTGSPPFRSSGDTSLAAVVRRVLLDPPPDLRARGVPDPLAGLVNTLLSKNPGERPTSADHLVAMLATTQPDAVQHAPPKSRAAFITTAPNARHDQSQGADNPATVIRTTQPTATLDAPVPVQQKSRSRLGWVAAGFAVSLAVGLAGIIAAISLSSRSGPSTEQGPSSSTTASGLVGRPASPTPTTQGSATVPTTPSTIVNPTMTRVPDVNGSNADKAVTALQAEGLEAQLDTDNSSSVAAGFVIRQQPGAGQQVTTGSVVRLTVSIGPSSPVPVQPIAAESQPCPQSAGANETKRDLTRATILFTFDATTARGAICQVDGAFIYYGVRKSDGAEILLDAQQVATDVYTATNGLFTYRVTSASLEITKSGGTTILSEAIRITR
jgi:serine/threonine protein kinase